jgi:hypothetical protein
MVKIPMPNNQRFRKQVMHLLDDFPQGLCLSRRPGIIPLSGGI